MTHRGVVGRLMKHNVSGPTMKHNNETERFIWTKTIKFEDVRLGFNSVRYHCGPNAASYAHAAIFWLLDSMLNHVGFLFTHRS